MAFTVTWAARPFSLGPVKHHKFSFTALASDLSMTLSAPTFSDRIDYALVDGVVSTSVDTLAGTVLTRSIMLAGNNLYSFVITSGSATQGATYVAANGQQFVIAATVASAVAVTGNSVMVNSALAASGTLTKIAGTGDATLAYSAVTPATVFGTGEVFGV